MEETILRLSNVRKSYKSFSLNCTMEVKPGQITGLVGKNGAGKSTTFKSILDLISIEDGEIYLFGKEHKDLLPKERQQIGVVLAEAGFSEYLTVRDVTAILQGLYPQFDKEDFKAKCVRFSLPMDKKIKEFSTGMKAKLNLLAAMSHKARFLILDEPTAGFDAMMREEMLAMLQEYMDEDVSRSILISSHIASDLEHFCDDVYVIEEGEICFHEEMDVLLDRYGVLKVGEVEYDQLDKDYLLRRKQESYGYSLLTNERQFYMENYPQITVEPAGIDVVLGMYVKGAAV